jgi:hypothetical protein
MGLAGFDQWTGTIQWRHADPDMLHGILCGADRLVYSRVLEYSSDGNVCLVWLDPRTGEEISYSLLDSLAGDAVRFGPLVENGDHIWGFFGRGFKEAARELVELVPDSSFPPAGPLHPNRLAQWVDDVLPRSFAHTAMVLPEWVLTTTQNFPGKDKGVEWLPEFRGERFVIKTRLGNNRPVHFTREIHLKPKEQPTLQLRVGHEAGKSWTVNVNLGNQLLLEQIVDDVTAPDGWLEQNIDLKAWAGSTVWISVTQAGTKDKEPGDAFWKSLEIQGQPSPGK